MSKSNFSIDADIVILYEKDGEIDTNSQPLPEERRTRAQEYLARQQEMRKLAEEYAKNYEVTKKLPLEDDDSITMLD